MPNDKVTKIPLRKSHDVKPCERCGDIPEATLDDRGFTVYHLCGDRFSIAANYSTLEDSIVEWNNLVSRRSELKGGAK